MPLVRGESADRRKKNAPEMFERLQQRIGLRARRRRLLARQKAAHNAELSSAPANDAVDRFEGKRQTEGFGSGFDRRAPEQFAEQRPQQRGGESVAGQHAREKQRESFAAAAPLPAIRTERPLAPDNLAVHYCRVVAAQHAVAVQRAPAPAVRAAPLLERKSTALNSSSSRTNRTGVVTIAGLPARKPPRRARQFPTALPIHGTRFKGETI